MTHYETRPESDDSCVNCGKPREQKKRGRPRKSPEHLKMMQARRNARAYERVKAERALLKKLTEFASQNIGVN